jgi:hypothetical protein
MTQRLLLVTAMLTFGMVFPISHATADPIRITGGSAVFDERAHATVDVQGLQGLHAQFNNFLLNNTGPWQCIPCPPGTTVTPFGFIESIDGAGTVKFRGVSYDLGATSIGTGQAVISIRPSGPGVIVPPLASRHVILRTPFELPSSSGSFLEFSPREDEFIDVPLTGKGLFTMELMPNANGEPAWEIAQIRYDFAPTPEPATLVLFTTGLGTLAWQRRRRSQE